jgi:hypothetical protein
VPWAAQLRPLWRIFIIVFSEVREVLGHRPLDVASELVCSRSLTLSFSLLFLLTELVDDLVTHALFLDVFALELVVHYVSHIV